MRNLEEYKAEIFRKSDEKKTEIKKRNRCIIAAVLPLVICISAIVSAVVPQVSMDGEGFIASGAEAVSRPLKGNEPVEVFESNEQNENYNFESYTPTGSYYIEFNRAEITDGKKAEQIDNEQLVRELYVKLMSYVGAESEYGREECSSGNLSSKKFDVKITLYSKQNITWVYIIDGNTLMHLTPTGDCKVTLPESEINAIKELLL